MYVIINNQTNKATTTRQKVIVANLIGAHRNTITNKLKISNPFIYKDFTVYEAVFVKDNVTKGNTLTFAQRLKKQQEKEGYY